MFLVMLVTVAVLLASQPVVAQDTVSTASRAVPVWDTELIGRFSATQAGYSNWAKGGVNTLAFSTGLNGRMSRTSSSWQQKHELKLAFGLVKQDTLEFRKADDEIATNSSLQYRGNGVFRLFNPTLAFQTRTQFAHGYNYKKNPFEDGRPPPVRVSAFLSPAILTQSLGLTYDPSDWFTQRLGIGSKQTVVLIPEFRALYGVPERGPALVEIGFESRTHVEREIVENVLLKSTLGLFAAFNKPDMPDLTWQNLIVMKVNSWLSVNVELEALYDRDISQALQIKEVVSIGVTYGFI